MIYITAPIEYHGFDASGFGLFCQKKTHLFGPVAFAFEILIPDFLVQGRHGSQGMSLAVVDNLGINVV